MTKAAVTPTRIVWAVNQLQITPNQRILEIGAGRGVAADLVCARLANGNGSYLGIDRSATAVAASNERNQPYIERQTAQFQQLALEDLDPGAAGRFDTVFAVNVNLFWTRPAQRDLAMIRQLLKGQGKLWLFYEPPTASVTSRISELFGERLNEASYTYDVARETIEGSLLLRFRCSPH
jgi:SAM-dependent methyltransferase